MLLLNPPCLVVSAAPAIWNSRPVLSKFLPCRWCRRQPIFIWGQNNSGFFSVVHTCAVYYIAAERDSQRELSLSEGRESTALEGRSSQLSTVAQGWAESSPWWRRVQSCTTELLCMEKRCRGTNCLRVIFCLLTIVLPAVSFGDSDFNFTSKYFCFFSVCSVPLPSFKASLSLGRFWNRRFFPSVACSPVGSILGKTG